MATRRTYGQEYKQEAVRLVTESSMKVSRVARDLGIGVNLVARWRRELEADGATAFPGKGQPRDAEVARLQRENEMLRQERDILKKALGIFSDCR